MQDLKAPQKANSFTMTTMTATNTTTTNNMQSTMDNTRFQFKSLSNPPSSVLEDGRFIYLPPVNSSQFFGRSIAKYNLVKAEGGDDADDANGNEDTTTNIDEQTNQLKTNQSSSNKKEEKDQQPKIHPIQIASARLQTHGIAELSKGINLSTLIQSNEYFGLTTVVDQSARNKSQLDTNESSKQTTNDTKKGSSDDKKSTTDQNNSSKSNTSTPNNNNNTTSTSKLNDENNNNKQISIERILRSKYILKRKQNQYSSSSQTFQSQYKKLKVITKSQQSIDCRLLELRKRWRLNVPNHGKNVKHPIQPCDVIAVDVDIYSRRNDGSSNSSNSDGGGGLNDILDRVLMQMNSRSSSSSSSSVLGRIARMVPRFATIELSKDYDILQKLRDPPPAKQGQNNDTTVLNKDDDNNNDGNNNGDEIMQDATESSNNNNNDNINVTTTTTTTTQNDTNDDNNDDTIAQPFLIKESSTGADHLLQNDTMENIPMLTLVFQIEKSSTGFIQSVALSSNIANSDDDNDQDDNGDSHKDKDDDNTKKESTEEKSSSEKTSSSCSNDKKNQSITAKIIQNKISVKKDELLIQSLQHSLFCANVFDSIRQEIIQDQTQQQHHQNQQQKQQSQKQRQKNIATSSSSSLSSTSRQQQIAWLSTGMEDTFLPSTSLMAGIRNNITDSDDVDSMMNNGDKINNLLSVIYCHEGEVKVRLNSEYSFIIKLVDVNNYNMDDNGKENDSKDGFRNGGTSGSQTPEQLHLLCRLLLLQAQTVYHNSRKEQSKRIDEILQAFKDESSDGSNGNMSKFVDYSAGIYRGGGGGFGHMNNPATMRLRKQIEAAMAKEPHILQKCVGLGAKFILEGKIRKVLKRLISWQKTRSTTPLDMKIEWLSLSVFDPTSQLAISLLPNHILDITISGNGITVCSFGDDGGFRSVHFGTSDEFELFMKHEILSNL